MNDLVYLNSSALQAVGLSRASGIVMPFNVRNKHRMFANETTEFGLDLFPHKPFLYIHMLDGILAVHGEVRVMEIRDVGLWADVEIDEFAHNFIQTKRSGFSTGSLPQLVAVTANGFMTRWVVVELSFAEEHQLANLPGTTTAMLQASCPDLVSPSSIVQTVSRGIWTMLPPVVVPESVPPSADAPAPSSLALPLSASLPPASPPASLPPTAPLPVPPPADSPAPVSPDPPALSPPVPYREGSLLSDVAVLLAPMQQGIGLLTDRLTALENPPKQKLPAPPPDASPPPVHIEVAGPYDGRTLQALLMENRIRTARAHGDDSFLYQPDNVWYRTVATKLAELYKQGGDLVPRCVGRDDSGSDYFSVPSAPIPTQVYEEWTHRVPFLQADEIMRSDFTNFGLELVPTLYATVIYHFMRAESVVFGLFEAFSPSSYPDWSWPVTTGGPTFRRVPQASDDTQMDYQSSPIPASKVGTDKRDFTAGSIGARTAFSDQLLKGSSVGLLDAMMMEYLRAVAFEIDWLILNGAEEDTTANISNLGTAPSAGVYDKALVVDGLRHMSIVTTTADSASETTIAITTPAVGAAKMGARGVIGDDIPNVVMLACPESARKFYALTEYHSIADVGESRNSLLKGFVGNVGGYDLLSTPAIELADSAGKYTDNHTAGTLGQVVFVHRKVIKVALFFPPRIIAKYVEHSRTTQMFANVELDVNQLEIGGTACLYNNTV